MSVPRAEADVIGGKADVITTSGAAVIRGRTVMREDELIAEPAGQPVRFVETLAVEEG